MKKKILFCRVAIVGAWVLFLIPEMSSAVKTLTNDDPKFKKGDTVMQRKSEIVYILDSVTYRPHGKQVFYNAHELNNSPVTWLPENSIKPLRKY
jgi:hypothetical protein